jgi:hypothetical protein
LTVALLGASTTRDPRGSTATHEPAIMSYARGDIGAVGIRPMLSWYETFQGQLGGQSIVIWQVLATPYDDFIASRYINALNGESNPVLSSGLPQMLTGLRITTLADMARADQPLVVVTNEPGMLTRLRAAGVEQAALEDVRIEGPSPESSPRRQVQRTDRQDLSGPH